MTTRDVDLVLRGGRIIDPAQSLDTVGDVVIDAGQIIFAGPSGSTPPFTPRTERSVSGLVVTPGLVDGHSHVFGGVGVSDPDAIGVRQGVTTIVDAGGVGPLTFGEFEALIPGHVATDVYAYASFFGPAPLSTFSTALN